MVLITYFPQKSGRGFFFSRHLTHTKKEKNKLYYIIHIVCMCVCVCVLIRHFFFASSSFFDVWFDLLVSWLTSHKRRSPMMTAHSEFRNSPSLFYDDVMMMSSFVLMSVIDFVSASFDLIFLFLNGNYSTKQRLSFPPRFLSNLN